MYLKLRKYYNFGLKNLRGTFEFSKFPKPSPSVMIQVNTLQMILIALQIILTINEKKISFDARKVDVNFSR